MTSKKSFTLDEHLAIPTDKPRVVARQYCNLTGKVVRDIYAVEELFADLHKQINDPDSPPPRTLIERLAYNRIREALHEVYNALPSAHSLDRVIYLAVAAQEEFEEALVELSNAIEEEIDLDEWGS